jgi:uncharacterized membrane protein
MNQATETYPREVHRANGRLLQIQRWGSLLGGGALAAFGVSRRSRTGVALAAAGGLLAYGGVRATRKPNIYRAVASFSVNTSPEHAFRFWRNFENLPLFMRHLDRVRAYDDRRSQWVARGPLGMNIGWEAEIVDERENERISWRSLPGSDMLTNGTVEFRRAPGDRGTIVTAVFQYTPPAGPIGRGFAKFLGKDPDFTVREDLRRFKALIEAGEIPTTEGQPHGRRSMLVRAIHATYPSRRKGTEYGARELVGAERRVS